MSRILVVDDKELMRDSVATTLVRKGHAVTAVNGARAALAKMGEKSYDAVITDLQMPEMDGLELLREIRRIDEQLPVIFMTAYGTVDTAVQALKEGAYDYITKPFSGDVLLVAAERAIEHARLLKENAILKLDGMPSRTRPGSAGSHRHEMIGDGRTMTELQGRLRKISASQGTVLISGESGAGKEVAARWIHEHSDRADKPFLAINCAALSTSLLESELFGHEKGAFTGADRLRKGRFELADGGTLLLDEISEIAPSIQAKLLRVLQEQAFERVGSSSSRSVDVRVIATTNRNLPAEVEKETFRQDLFFRLNVLPLHMPALRDHAEDIPTLARHFLEQVAQREGRPVKRVNDEAIQFMQRYGWPGNVRELQNICERALVLTNGECIEASLIAPWLRGCTVPGATMQKPASMIEVADAGFNDTDVGIICDGELTLGDIERESIVATLKANKGHRQKSARALGIGVRTLGLKLKKWKEEQVVASSL